MYDAENVAFKFSRMKRHLNSSALQLTLRRSKVPKLFAKKTGVDFALHNLGQTFIWVVAYIPGFGSFVSNPE